MQKLSLISKIYITAVVLTGAAVLANGVVHWQWGRPAELLALLVMTLVASRLKVKLPGINGSMSVNLPFLLIIAIRLGSAGSVAVAALAALVQSIPTAKKRPALVQVLFNVATVTNAVAAAGFISGFASHRGLAMPLSIAAAGAMFFLANTLPVALVLWLAEGERPFRTWRGIARLSVPYYTLSAGVAAIVCEATQFALWSESLALLPLMYAIFTSYRGYFAPAAAEIAPVAEGKPMGRVADAAKSASAAVN